MKIRIEYELPNDGFSFNRAMAESEMKLPDHPWTDIEARDFGRSIASCINKVDCPHRDEMIRALVKELGVETECPEPMPPEKWWFKCIEPGLKALTRVEGSRIARVLMRRLLPYAQEPGTAGVQKMRAMEALLGEEETNHATP